MYHVLCIRVKNCQCIHVYIKHHGWLRTCMSINGVTRFHVTYVKNESWHIWMSHGTYEWVMAHLNESWHIWMSYVTYEWVMWCYTISCRIREEWFVTHIYGSWLTYIANHDSFTYVKNEFGHDVRESHEHTWPYVNESKQAHICIHLQFMTRIHVTNYVSRLSTVTSPCPSELSSASENVTTVVTYVHFDRKKPPTPGGFPIYYVPSSRTVGMRTLLEAPGTNSSRGVLLLTVLDEGT